MIKWERGGPVYATDRAVWKQIADEVRRRIIDGVYTQRNAIPSLNALVQEFGVARNTIRKVVELLESEGYVRAEMGVGTFVTPKSNWPQ
ncbi:GntR family transcriptional regulator [Nonomuraea sp. NPDC059023]|uniref:GntR family transcriptional regulator n=1 Tax=unclassified Nonomuraea TaxID=2593643 RepID=UPI00367B3640